MPLSFKSKLFALSIALLIHAAFIVAFKSSQQGLASPSQAGVQITFSPPPSFNTVNAEKAVLDEVDATEVIEEAQTIDVIEAKPVTVPVKAPVYQAALTPEPKTEKKVIKKPIVEAIVAKVNKKSDYVITEPQKSEKGVISQLGNNRQAQTSYQSIIHALLVKHKKYPLRALARRQEGTVTMQFIVQKNGSISSYEVISSSGHRLLDHEAEKLLKRVSPLLPPFPDNLNMDYMRLSVPINFFIRT